MDKKKLTVIAVAGVALLVLGAVFLARWLSAETVSGKVMVVQRNAEVRKLALVRIYVFLRLRPRHGMILSPESAGTFLMPLPTVGPSVSKKESESWMRMTR